MARLGRIICGFFFVNLLVSLVDSANNLNSTEGLITKCIGENTYFVSIPYTISNSTILEARAGSCNENSSHVTYVQDATRFNVTIDLEKCDMNTERYNESKVQIRDLFLANLTNLKIGREGKDSEYVYLNMNIITECGRKMEYGITYEYGPIMANPMLDPNATDPHDQIITGGWDEFKFRFEEHTDLEFNATKPPGPRMAGNKAFISITATDMDINKYTFHVPDCKIVTSSGVERKLFANISGTNKFIDLYKAYRTVNNTDQFLLSHIFFVVDRNDTTTYNLTCNVKVCKKNYIGDNCQIKQSCGSNLCAHGSCIDSLVPSKKNPNATRYRCECDDGYTGKRCNETETSGAHQPQTKLGKVVKDNTDSRRKFNISSVHQSGGGIGNESSGSGTTASTPESAQETTVIESNVSGDGDQYEATISGSGTNGNTNIQTEEIYAPIYEQQTTYEEFEEPSDIEIDQFYDVYVDRLTGTKLAETGTYITDVLHTLSDTFVLFDSNPCDVVKDPKFRAICENLDGLNETLRTLSGKLESLRARIDAEWPGEDGSLQGNI